MTDRPNDSEKCYSVSSAYFTNAGAPGPVRYGKLPGSIGFLQAIDKTMTIGIASAVGRTERGLSRRKTGNERSYDSMKFIDFFE